MTVKFLTSDTENSFLTLIKAIAVTEQELEIYRQVLSDTPEFKAYSSFKQIANTEGSCITAQDLSNFLKDKENTPILELLILKYTEGVSEKMDFKAFCKMILPYNQRVRPILVKKEGGKMSGVCEGRLSKIVKRDIETSIKLDKHKIALRESRDFDLYMLFKMIDKNEGYITIDNLTEYLKDKKQKDLAEYVIRYLDIDIDGKLSYIEFEEGILPWYLENTTPTSSCMKVVKELRVDTSPESVLEYQTIKPPKTTPTLQHLITTNTRDYKKPFNPFYSPMRRQEKEVTLLSSDKKWMEEIKDTIGVSRISRTAMMTTSPGQKKSSLDLTNLKKLKATFGKNIAIDELIAVFKEQIRIEKSLEDHKVNLSLQPDFNLLDVYRIFNTKGKEYITFIEFIKGLKEIGLHKPEHDIKLMYSYYARNPYKKLTYANFCYMIQPINSNSFLKLCADDPKRTLLRGIKTTLSKYTQTMLKKLFNQLVETERAVENIRVKLSKSKCFNHYNAFKLIDSHKKGEVTMTDVNVV
jgi:Ca2+-binding EF-hand superfamily protein